MVTQPSEPLMASSGMDRRLSRGVVGVVVVVVAERSFRWTRFRLKMACERDD